MIQIVISDGHQLIREGVKKLIEQPGGIHVAGEAGNIPDTIQLIGRLRPDVVVMDINLCGQDGLDGLAELRHQFPTIPILVLSMYSEERFGVQAIKAGADGFITKSMAVEEVAKAIQQVCSGEGYVSPVLAKLLAMEVRGPGSQAPAKDALTNRELEVAALLCKGKKAKQIAGELSISISSVNTYRKRIFDKLKLASDVALIRYAFQRGLVE